MGRDIRDEWKERIAAQQAERIRSGFRLFLLYLATALVVFVVAWVFYYLIMAAMAAEVALEDLGVDYLDLAASLDGLALLYTARCGRILTFAPKFWA